MVFWRAFGRSGDRVGQSASATWEFIVGARTAPVDSSWGTIVDLNGDGFADVVIGAASANFGVGQVYVYLGSAAGLSPATPTVLSGQGSGNDFLRRRSILRFRDCVVANRAAPPPWPSLPLTSLAATGNAGNTIMELGNFRGKVRCGFRVAAAESFFAEGVCPWGITATCVLARVPA